MWWIQFISNRHAPLSVCHFRIDDKRIYMKSNFQCLGYHMQIITSKRTGLQTNGPPLLRACNMIQLVLSQNHCSLPPSQVLTSSKCCGTQFDQHSSVPQQQDVMVFQLCDVHNRDELENITLMPTLRTWIFGINFTMPKSKKTLWHCLRNSKNGLWRFPSDAPFLCATNLFLSYCRWHPFTDAVPPVWESTVNWMA